MSKRLCSLMLAGSFVGACGADGGDHVLQPPPPDLVVAGPYGVVSTYDLTTAALLPESANGYLQELKALRDDPAATFFRLLDQAGVPLAGDLLGVLPSPLDDRLKGWINDYVFGATFQGRPVRSELDVLLEQASTVLTRFQIASDLELPAASATGEADAAHALRELRYALWAGTVQVAVPFDLPGITLPGEIFVSETHAPARVSAGQGGADARLTLGDHAFGIPFGRLAWTALDRGSRQRNGGDVRATLGVLFGCPALGVSVAQHCVLGVCVGHAAEVTAICDRGLDEVVKSMRARIEALDFNAVRLQRGDASLWDAPDGGGAGAGPLDRRVDRLDHGVWKASIDIGMGPREVPASFVGLRR
ncbi:MAG: hypothetical protein ABUL67_01800 [Haliangium ochraceum]